MTVPGNQLRSWLVKEPNLIFGDGRKHVDPKTGLTAFGPLVIGDITSPIVSTIKLGIIGDRETIGLCERWINDCRRPIEGSESNPRLFPPFPGFARVFGTDIVIADAWKELLTETEVSRVVSTQRFSERVIRAVNLFDDKIANVAEREPRLDVIICALPQKIVDACATVGAGSQETRRRLTSAERELLRSIESNKKAGQLTLFPFEDEESLGLEFMPTVSNFRRLLKAEAMKYDIPTQLAWPSTFTGQGAGGRQLQQPATRAWNFFVALYYKAKGYPWKMAQAEAGTCYVGISFYVDRTSEGRTMRSSVAQVFTHTGEGLVLRGNRFIWDDPRSKTPHLNKDGAAGLMNRVIELYERQMHQRPRRIVVHKSSRYWKEETEGFVEAMSGVHEKDFLAIESRGIRFLRKGEYPPLRGTAIMLSNRDYILYTRGYIPYLGTYPGMRVPRPLEIVEHQGDSTPETVCSEIMGLTKMNWNTADFASADPITLAFSERIGLVLSQIPEEVIPRPQYRFYM
jgi:hypothetical protein